MNSTDYVVRSTVAMPSGAVLFTVVDVALDVINLMIPRRFTDLGGYDPIVRDCIANRPRPPVGP